MMEDNDFRFNLTPYKNRIEEYGGVTSLEDKIKAFEDKHNIKIWDEKERDEVMNTKKFKKIKSAWGKAMLNITTSCGCYMVMLNTCKPLRGIDKEDVVVPNEYEYNSESETHYNARREWMNFFLETGRIRNECFDRDDMSNYEKRKLDFSYGRTLDDLFEKMDKLKDKLNEISDYNYTDEELFNGILMNSVDCGYDGYAREYVAKRYLMDELCPINCYIGDPSIKDDVHRGVDFLIYDKEVPGDSEHGELIGAITVKPAAFLNASLVNNSTTYQHDVLEKLEINNAEYEAETGIKPCLFALDKHYLEANLRDVLDELFYQNPNIEDRYDEYNYDDEINYLPLDERISDASAILEESARFSVEGSSSER